MAPTMHKGLDSRWRMVDFLMVNYVSYHHHVVEMKKGLPEQRSCVLYDFLRAIQRGVALSRA